MPVPLSYVLPGPESVGDLVQRIADRDQAAFGRFYRRFVRAVFTEAGAVLGSPALAVAVTRAVFVEVWRLAPVSDLRSLDGRAWLTAITARRAADRLREVTASPDLGTGYDELLGRELALALGAAPPERLGSTAHPPDGLPLVAH